MFIYEALLRRAKNQSPIRVGLVGAGKFGLMFLAQAPSTPGLQMVQLGIYSRIKQRQLALQSVGQRS